MSQAAEPIREVLAKLLPPQGLVLEIASGTGEDIVHFARQLPHLAWLPSDADPAAVAAIAARRAEAGLQNLLDPVELDVTKSPWPIARADAIVCIDIAHVVPLDTVLALFGGAARALSAGGLLYVYGPFRFHGAYTAKSNEDLDQSLRARDPSLGLRDVRELTVAGTRTGLGLEHTIAMPPSCHSLVFRRRALLPPTGQFRV